MEQHYVIVTLGYSITTIVVWIVRWRMLPFLYENAPSIHVGSVRDDRRLSGARSDSTAGDCRCDAVGQMADSSLWIVEPKARDKIAGVTSLLVCFLSSNWQYPPPTGLDQHVIPSCLH